MPSGSSTSRKRRTLKRWSPALDDENKPQMFHAQLIERIRNNQPGSFQNLKDILAEAGHASAAKSKKSSRDV